MSIVTNRAICTISSCMFLYLTHTLVSIHFPHKLTQIQYSVNLSPLLVLMHAPVYYLWPLKSHTNDTTLTGSSTAVYGLHLLSRQDNRATTVRTLHHLKLATPLVALKIGIRLRSSFRRGHRQYRIAGIFRGYKCSRFSRIEPVPRKFIPTNIYE